jgi:hypothetical protein
MSKLKAKFEALAARVSATLGEEVGAGRFLKIHACHDVMHKLCDLIDQHGQQQAARPAPAQRPRLATTTDVEANRIQSQFKAMPAGPERSAFFKQHRAALLNLT